MRLLEQIQKPLLAALKEAYPQLREEELKCDLTEATSERFGHYQCNSAMQLARLLGQNPRQIATAWVAALKETELFAKVEVAGPGFINLTLSPSFLSQAVQALQRDPYLGCERPKRVQRIIVEFSSPNVAKEMHVGHLRSTIIGESLARLFEFLGHDVVRLNHIGDWGTAFGMLIAHLKEQGEEPTSLSQLMLLYKASKKRFDEDEPFKERARKAVVALQGGDPSALALWEKICAISEEAYKEVYGLLDVRLATRGESYYNAQLPQVVADLEKRGLVTISEGARCVFHEGAPIPLMVQKSDGGYNYDTTDVAAMRHRIEEERADRIIVVTDAGQSLHFQLVYLTCVKAGYLDPKKVRFDHVPFGLVLGSDGKRFRTRSGETERLMDLLMAAVAEARRMILERTPEMEAKEAEELAHTLGIGAVKYADLSSHRIHDYVFSYERMLRFEGNTAAFILYSYVRIAGIKRKATGFDPKAPLHLAHESEILLGLHLLRFPELLERMAEELLPHYLTDYLYILAQKFNLFFRDCPVLDSPEQQSRLLLCEATAQIMKRGLTILGLKTTERM